MIAKSSYTHRFMFFPSLCCSSFLCHLTQDYPIKSIMMLLLSSAIQSNLARPSPPAILWLRNLYRYSTYFIVITHCSSPVLCSQSYPRFVSLFELPMFNISRSLKPTRNHPKPSQAGMCILMGSSYIDWLTPACCWWNLFYLHLSSIICANVHVLYCIGMYWLHNLSFKLFWKRPAVHALAANDKVAVF